MNAIALRSASPGLVPSSVGEAMQLAQMMSDCGLLPDTFKGKPGNALMVVEQAMRWQMSPFAVAQEIAVIQGKLMYSGKIVAAAVHSSGVLNGRLSYAYTGSGDERTVTVSGLLRMEAAPREIQVRLKDAKTGNKVWISQSDQQLAYHGARVWARRFTPEVMLGVYAPEEMQDDAFQGATLEPVSARPIAASAAPAASRPALLERPRDPVDNDAIPDFDPPPVDKLAIATDRLIALMEASGDEAVLSDLMNDPQKVTWREKLAKSRPELELRIADAHGTVYARLTASQAAPADEPAPFGSDDAGQP